MKSIRTCSIAIILLLVSVAASAQTAMTLNVDATDAARNIVHSKLTIPVRPTDAASSFTFTSGWPTEVKT